MSKSESNSNSNFNVLLNNIEREMRPPTLSRMTLRSGRILWHARRQPILGQKRNVMRSTDYLYTSPQISQAILHGISTTRKNTLLELTKLRVKKPIHLIVFKNPKEQTNYAILNAGINNFQPYTLNDVKLFSHICKDDSIDGYRAKWDQDQISLCAKVIRTKLEKVSSYMFSDTNIKRQFGITSYNVNFRKPIGQNAMYYRTSNKTRGRRLVKSIKATEKKKAVRTKQNRSHLYRVLPHVKRYLKK